MKINSHRLLTSLAFELTTAVTPLSFDRVKTSNWSGDVDTRDDMELVQVRGIFGDRSRDDPHSFNLAINDRATSSTKDILDISAFYPPLHWTAMNHYIDIPKGEGTFDDYDGYAYHNGSACDCTHEKVGGVPVDEAIAAILSTSYVHAPGRRWYRGCSKAVSRYSREQDVSARFPLAGSRPGEDKGVPYSVFIPVDNIAAFWFSQVGDWDNAKCAGFVLHALQDASVPHHAAGTAGNWHVKWEEDQEGEVGEWVDEPSFHDEVKALYAAWTASPSPAPSGLAVGDLTLKPGSDWNMDMLATWLALHAYDAYQGAYGNFEEYKKGKPTMRELAVKATAMSMLALVKIEGELGP